jgi:hypothetical protein
MQKYYTELATLLFAIKKKHFHGIGNAAFSLQKLHGISNAFWQRHFN